MNVEQYIDNLVSPQKDIVKILRKIITAYSPNIKEEIKWNVPTYSIKINICAIMAHKKHVNFQLFQGAHLMDAQELEGTGKDMRHLKFYDPGDIDVARIKKLLKQAIQIEQ